MPSLRHRPAPHRPRRSRRTASGAARRPPGPPARTEAPGDRTRHSRRVDDPGFTASSSRRQSDTRIASVDTAAPAGHCPPESVRDRMGCHSVCHSDWRRSVAAAETGDQLMPRRGRRPLRPAVFPSEGSLLSLTSHVLCRTVTELHTGNSSSPDSRVIIGLLLQHVRRQHRRKFTNAVHPGQPPGVNLHLGEVHVHIASST